MTKDGPYWGNILSGELRGKPVKTFTDQLTGKKVSVTYFRILCLDDYNEEAFEELRVPDGMDHVSLQTGTTYSFPITQYIDKKSGKLRRTLRTDVPVFPAPMLKAA